MKTPQPTTPPPALQTSRGQRCVSVWVGDSVCSWRVLFLLHIHFNDIREETVQFTVGEHTKQEGSLAPSHTVSPWVLQLNMSCSVWPGWVLIKPDKDLSPVHGSMCCHSVRQRWWRWQGVGSGMQQSSSPHINVFARELNSPGGRRQ